MPSPIGKHACDNTRGYAVWETRAWANPTSSRSEEHTSELQSRLHLVCRLLLEKKKNTTHISDKLASALTTHRRGPPETWRACPPRHTPSHRPQPPRATMQHDLPIRVLALVDA